MGSIVICRRRTMQQRLFLLVSMLFSISYAISGVAEENHAPSLADVATNIMEPTVIVAHIAHFVYMVIGISFVLASVIKFFERRINPLGVTIGQIVFLFITGFLMLFIPYIF